MSTLRLMLVRHGETPSNVNQLLCSRPPGPPLTELGRSQAQAFAERMVTEPVAAVYASVALRAQQTAEPIARVHGLDVAVLDGVHEVFCGDLEGRSDPESVAVFRRVFTAWTGGALDERLPGGESGAQVRARYLKAIEDLRAAHADGTVVLVSHGGVIRLAAEWLAGVTPPTADVGLLPNTGRVVLEANGAGWRCLEWPGVDL